MPIPQSYSIKDAENILDNANRYRTSANENAELANKYIKRDANAKTNLYDGKHSQLNNQLVKVGHEYVYITQSGVARKVSGGVGSKWSLDGGTDNDQYTRFSDVPNSDCPADVTVLSDIGTINDLKVKEGGASLYKGKSITNHTLTACGAEGSLVYISEFMDFTPIKIGGSDGFYVGNGEKFVFLDAWYTSDWKTVAPIACKVATQSGYKTVKLVIDNAGINTPVVKCYVSDVDLDSNLTGGKGFNTTYATSKVGNKVTANPSNCTESKVAAFKHNRDNYDVKIKPGYENGLKVYEYAEDLFYPESDGVFNVTSKDVRQGIPVGENDTNDNNTQGVQYYYVKNRKVTTRKLVESFRSLNHHKKKHKKRDLHENITPMRPAPVYENVTTIEWNNTPQVNPCSEYTTYTQNYNVTCSEMSDYPYTRHHSYGWGKRLPGELRRCNALYKVWNTGIVNTNIYVGNVGYVTHEGTMQHIAYNLLMYEDNNIDGLISYAGSRVCRNSKQYKSNRNQIMKRATFQLEDAKHWCATNAHCAGFEIIGTSVTFYWKAKVYCGEKTATLNSVLPLTEDPYRNYTTFWKPLVLKIKNPNRGYLESDNRKNMTVVKDKNRSEGNVSANYYQSHPENYTWDVRNITGGCPESVTGGFYGQLWYGYRNNGYIVHTRTGFICKSLETDTQSKISKYTSRALPNANNYIKNTVIPAFSSIINRTGETQEAAAKEGLTTMEEEYGNEIVGIMNQKLPASVNYNGINYTINDKDTLDSYSILQGQLTQGIMTSDDATIQITNLLTPTPTPASETDATSGDDDDENSYSVLGTKVTVPEGFTSSSSDKSGGGGGSLVSIMDILNDDASVISEKNGYHYVLWILVALCIGLFIVLIAFSIIPALNSKGVLKPLTIGLGSLSLVLVVMKYNLIPIILEFLNYFIYNQ